MAERGPAGRAGKACSGAGDNPEGSRDRPGIRPFLYGSRGYAMEKWRKGSRNVTILELLPRIGTSIGRSTGWVMRDEIKKQGIEVITSAKITKFDANTVEFEHQGEKKKLEGIDTFILATGVKPNRDLLKSVKKLKPPFKTYRIGDCKKPRTILEAIHEGFKIAYKLDEKV